MDDLTTTNQDTPKIWGRLLLTWILNCLFVIPVLIISLEPGGDVNEEIGLASLGIIFLVVAFIFRRLLQGTIEISVNFFRRVIITLVLLLTLLLIYLILQNFGNLSQPFSWTNYLANDIFNISPFLLMPLFFGTIIWVLNGLFRIVFIQMHQINALVGWLFGIVLVVLLNVIWAALVDNSFQVFFLLIILCTTFILTPFTWPLVNKLNQERPLFFILSLCFLFSITLFSVIVIACLLFEDCQFVYVDSRIWEQLNRVGTTRMGLFFSSVGAGSVGWLINFSFLTTVQGAKLYGRGFLLQHWGKLSLIGILIIVSFFIFNGFETTISLIAGIATTSFVTIIIFSYLIFKVYPSTGKRHAIPLIYFFSRIDWGVEGLLEKLRYDSPQSYFALKQDLKDASPLTVHLFSLLKIDFEVNIETLFAHITDEQILADRGEIAHALDALTPKWISKKEKNSYSFKYPKLAKIFVDTAARKNRSHQVELARQSTHIYQETVQFLETCNFTIQEEKGSSFKLQSDTATFKKLDKKGIVVQMIGGQSIRSQEIESFAQFVGKTLENNIENYSNHVGLLIINDPLDAGALARTHAYRFDENFIIIPLLRSYIRSVKESKQFAEKLDHFISPDRQQALQFFIKCGFEIGEDDNYIVLHPTTKGLQRQIGQQTILKVIQSSSLARRDIENLANHSQQKLIDSEGKRVAFLVHNQSRLSPGVQNQIRAYRFEEGIIIIPIRVGQIDQAIKNNQIENELNKIIQDQLSEKRDLYNVTTPVIRENFYGRIQEIEQFLGYLDETEPVGLFALNKMGKTSLIQNIIFKLEDFAVASIDLQSVSKNVLSIYQEIIRQLKNDISLKWSDISHPTYMLLMERVSDDAPAAFESDLRLIIQTLQNQIEQPRIIVFIDEIDLLIPIQEGQHNYDGFDGYLNLLQALRGLKQKGIPINFAVIGLQPQINRAATLGGVENAGFQIFKERFLTPMPKIECDFMITDIGEQMGLSFSSPALAVIFAESGGHPFLARQLCSLIWNNLSKANRNESNFTIHPNHVLKAADAFIDDGHKSANLKEIFRTRINSKERKILQELADHKQPSADLPENRNPIRSLEERRLIQVLSHNQFGITARLLQRWIRVYILGYEK